MDRTVRTHPVSDVDIVDIVDAAAVDGRLSVSVLPEGDTCVVRAAGELDRASRDQLFAASTAGDHHEMLIDLAAVSFMDCSGYGGLVASRLRVEGDGRTLTVRGIRGQPKHLLDLIERLEREGEIGRVDTPTTTGYELSMLGTRASRRQTSRQAGRRAAGA